MANKSNHEIVAVFQNREYKDIRWHVDKNGTIVRTTGLKDGKGKIVMIRRDEAIWTEQGPVPGAEVIYCGLIRIEQGRHSVRRAKVSDPIIQAQLKGAFDQIKEDGQ